MTKLQIWKLKDGRSYEEINKEMGGMNGTEYYRSVFQGKFKCNIRNANRLNRLTHVDTYSIQNGI